MTKTIKYKGKELELYFSHERVEDQDSNILPRGGITSAFIQLKDKDDNVLETVEATSNCSNKDNYSKRVGRTIAEGRLRKLVEEKGE